MPLTLSKRRYVCLGRFGWTERAKRMVESGRHVVILVDPETQSFYQVDDPQLGEAEPALVEAMLRVLGGGL